VLTVSWFNLVLGFCIGFVADWVLDEVLTALKRRRRAEGE
jgi:multisubunit Na+/H+ antiporter MnhE subunit